MLNRQTKCPPVSGSGLGARLIQFQSLLLVAMLAQGGCSNASEPPPANYRDAESIAIAQPAKISVEGETLFYDGAINQVSVAEVERQLRSARAAKVSRIVIKSPGGNGDAGLPLGETVRDLKLAIVVDGYCMSACANYVALGASDLFVPNDGVLGFHGGVLNISSAESEKWYRDLLKNSGMPDELIGPQIERDKALYQRELAFFQSIGVSHAIVEDSRLKKGRDPTSLWMFTREVLESCYAVKNIRQYPDLPQSQTRNRWADVIRTCPSAS